MKKYHLFLLLLLQAALLHAQTIEGKVSELADGEKVPLPGATIFWVGSTIGTTTASDGTFSLKKNSKYNKLVASFVGYASDTLAIPNADNPLEFILAPNAQIDEVQVIGREPGTQMSRMTAIQQQVISGAELRKAACCNLSESFQTNASVDVNYSDAVTGAKQIQLLGLAGTYTQMMTENIPNLRGLAGVYKLGYVPGSWMESIQVSKGTSQVVNGYESTTGQINIEYKKPTDKDRIYANGYVNNFGKYELNANSAFKVSDKSQSIVLAHFENLGVINDHNHDGFTDDPLVRQYNLMNRWFYHPNQNVEMRFGFSVLDEDRRGGQTAFLKDNHPESSSAYGTGIKTQRYNVYSKTGFFFKDPSTSIGIIADGTYHHQDAFFGLNKYEGTQKSLYINSILQAPVVKTKNNVEQLLNTGISLQLDNFDEVLNDSLFKRTDAIPGIFAQYTLSIGTTFSLIAGLRGDYTDKEGFIVTPRFHLRKAFDENSNTVIRLSAGRGWRQPNLISENLSLLASSRQAVVSPYRNFEDGWNFGTSLLKNITIAGRTLTASIDFYHTLFNRQIIADIDINPQKIYYYELDGRSYSNSFQAEVKYFLLENLELTGAYRINDVKVTTDGKLQQKPFTSKYKGLISASYATQNHHWKFDLTAQFNGPGRIPSTSSNPDHYQRPESFEAYTLMFAQVTRSFKRFDLYIGSENLTGYTQKHPVIASEDPFGPYFDASMIWGPLSGKMFYAGFRYKLF